MTRDRRSRTTAARAQGGFALVSGVFLVTMLFLLSAYLIGLRVHQDASASLDVLGSRAFAAAASGAEWAAYKSLRNNECAATLTWAIAASGLTGFTTTITCTRSTYNEAGTTVTVDTITANACNQPEAGKCPSSSPGANYVERQLTMAVGF